MHLKAVPDRRKLPRRTGASAGLCLLHEPLVRRYHRLACRESKAKQRNVGNEGWEREIKERERERERDVGARNKE